MFEDLRTPLSNFAVTLRAGTLGVFEPVSCLMFMNVTDAEFDAWRAEESPGDPVGLTFSHEMHHYFQVIATGYMFDRYRQLVLAFRDAKTPPRFQLTILRSYVRRKARKALYRVRYFFLPRDDRALLTQTDQFWLTFRDQLDLEKLAADSGQTTMVGLMCPGLSEQIEAVQAPALLRGADGLSAQDVFEGSAVVYALVMEYDHAGADQMLRTRALQDDSPYERLPLRALARAGDRSVSQALLAAAALALRFERPGDAVLRILDRLLEAPVGSEVEAARALDLASITSAGKLLGTAREVRAADAPGADHADSEEYMRPLDRMSSGEWSLDELKLLTESDAIEDIPYGQLSFGIITRDGVRGPRGTTNLNGRRMMGCFMLFGGRTVSGARKELADFFYDNRMSLLP